MTQNKHLGDEELARLIDVCETMIADEPPEFARADLEKELAMYCELRDFRALITAARKEIAELPSGFGQYLSQDDGSVKNIEYIRRDKALRALDGMT